MVALKSTASYAVQFNMRKQAAEKRVAEIVAAYDAQLNALGDEVRASIVLPACQKYGLTFCAGMGSYSFYDPRHSAAHMHVINDPDDAKRRGFGLKAVFDVLNINVDRQHNIGDLVPDVRLEDLTK